MNPSDDTAHLDDTAELPVLRPILPTVSEPVSTRFQVDFGAMTHLGLVRPCNEDRYLFARFGRSLHTLMTNLSDQRLPRRLDEVGYALLVADGLGGAAGGEFASELAALTLVSLVLDTPDWVLSNQSADIARVLQRMGDRFEQIDKVLKDRGGTEPSLAGMGTTMTLAASLGPRVVIAHIGDSRAYLLRGGILYRVTRDHTVAQGLVDAGFYDKTEQVAHHFRHVLARCLGGTGDACKPDLQQLTLADGDQLLLCTDGLTNMVDEANIARILAELPTAQAACQVLVDAALTAGGKDNVTVVLARYRLLAQ